MEQILKIQDLQLLQRKVSNELLGYLEQEFKDLYEYYSLGERIEDFILQQCQSMVLVQKDEELVDLLNEPFAIEFVDRIIHEGFPFYRIGYRNTGEIQLYYGMESNHSKAITDKLNRFSN
ncbi:hypothetical protein EI976_12595 [Bacillus licheniformis]|uniref:hypothetical protein n=1 Tax=Bacillus licheniformis TaxID=1402 RepID=UPI000D130395|nr:hypothetical protein [Bacillus licheniformis]KAA0808420.1 hypothetical protein EI978_15315 [Bacillus licheniformis]KAA0821887.1 hypothetical protein EI976_12595 [Bacillus licheniformis]KAA0823941.1 hypothetical protein EI973_11935 [Bacillus licheniformis]PSS52605.1 hypothetical protein C6399_17815 [Bacillus licheniformis]